MGLIDEAVDAFENEVNNLKLNIKDTVQAMDYEYAGSLYDTVLTTKLGTVSYTHLTLPTILLV